jgi:DNA polymerase zeta
MDGELGFDIADLISRAPGRGSGGSIDHWGMKTHSTFKVAGRHVLNLWRVMRAEQSLNMYSFENVAFHVLRRRSAIL